MSFNSIVVVVSLLVAYAGALGFGAILRETKL